MNTPPTRAFSYPYYVYEDKPEDKAHQKTDQHLFKQKAQRAQDRSPEKLVKGSQWSPFPPQKHNLKTRDRLIRIFFVHCHQRIFVSNYFKIETVV